MYEKECLESFMEGNEDYNSIQEIDIISNIVNGHQHTFNISRQEF